MAELDTEMTKLISQARQSRILDRDLLSLDDQINAIKARSDRNLA